MIPEHKELKHIRTAMEGIQHRLNDVKRTLRETENSLNQVSDNLHIYLSRKHRELNKQSE